MQHEIRYGPTVDPENKKERLQERHECGQTDEVAEYRYHAQPIPGPAAPKLKSPPKRSGSGSTLDHQRVGNKNHPCSHQQDKSSKKQKRTEYENSGRYRS